MMHLSKDQLLALLREAKKNSNRDWLYSRSAIFTACESRKGSISLRQTCATVSLRYSARRAL